MNKQISKIVQSEDSGSQATNITRNLSQMVNDFSEFDKKKVCIKFNDMIIIGYIMDGSFVSYDKDKVVLHPYLEVKALGTVEPVKIFLNHISEINWHTDPEIDKSDQIVVPAFTNGHVIPVVKRLEVDWATGKTANELRLDDEIDQEAHDNEMKRLEDLIHPEQHEACHLYPCEYCRVRMTPDEALECDRKAKLYDEQNRRIAADRGRLT